MKTKEWRKKEERKYNNFEALEVEHIGNMEEIYHQNKGKQEWTKTI